MSQVKVSANVSGSGIFTIASPNSNTDRTLTLPDATDTLVGKATSDTLTNKTLTTPTITNNLTFGTALAETPSGSAPLAFCRAWVNFNGTGTVAIRAAFNVSSITDNGTGDYTVNFTNAMPDANYAVSAFANHGANTTVAGLVSYGNDYAPAVGSVRLKTVTSASYTAQDPQYFNVAVHR